MSGVVPAFELTEQLFAVLHRLTHDGAGITRDTYGAGEEKAHDLIKEVVRRFDLTPADVYFGRDRAIIAIRSMPRSPV